MAKKKVNTGAGSARQQASAELRSLKLSPDVSSTSEPALLIFSFHVTRPVPAIYHQIGVVKVVDADLRTASARARAGMAFGDLVPEWIAPEDETIGVELVHGAEPGVAYIDILEPFDVRPVDRA